MGMEQCWATNTQYSPFNTTNTFISIFFTCPTCLKPTGSSREGFLWFLVVCFLNFLSHGIWQTIGRLVLIGPKYLKINLSQCHLVHYKFHVQANAWWQADGYLPELWHKPLKLKTWTILLLLGCFLLVGNTDDAQWLTTDTYYEYKLRLKEVR